MPISGLWSAKGAASSNAIPSRTTVRSQSSAFANRMLPFHRFADKLQATKSEDSQMNLSRRAFARVCALTATGRALTRALPGVAQVQGEHFNTTTAHPDRKSTRLNSSHLGISYAVFCLKKKTDR